jgi:cell wall-associated NlpC family hydrolase
VITPAVEAVDVPAATAAPASVPAVEAAPEALAVPAFASSVVARTLPVTLVELRPRGIAAKTRASARRQAKPRPVQKVRPARSRPAQKARTVRAESTSRPRFTSTQRSRTQHGSTQRPTTQRATKRQVSKQRTSTRRTRTASRSAGARRGMSAVIEFARAQVGKRYSSGASGPNWYDCSGLTMRAYQRAGLRLPHSSGGQAARARTVSRARALPGDLVVGPGHVGVYMGGGMMVDAGNRRTGVVYRRLYAGLHIERF